MSDPVVIQAETSISNQFNVDKATFTLPKRQLFHNPSGSPHATGNLRDFWNYVVKQPLASTKSMALTTRSYFPEIALQQLEAASDHSIMAGHAAFILQLWSTDCFGSYFSKSNKPI